MLVGVVLGYKGNSVETAEIVDGIRKRFMGPVPPCNAHQRSFHFLAHSLSYHRSWNTGHNDKRLYVLRHNRAGTHNSPCPDSNSRQDGRSVPYPDIMAEDHLVVSAPLKDLLVIFPKTIEFTSVGKMMGSRPPDGMIARVDTAVARNGAKLSKDRKSVV